MSLIIKGMKLPENDGMKELVIGRAPNGTEPIAIVSGDITEFYKIIEIPTPHGRLIDADKFLKDNADFADRDFIHPSSEVTLRELIDGAPSIVEAEVSE